MATERSRAELDRELAGAAFVCDFVKVRALLDQGASVEARDEQGRTPLTQAVLGGSIGLVGLLLEEGCDVNARDEEGWTALHFAAQEYLPEIARILIGRGADPNAQDADGGSVLWRAIFSAAGRDEIVRLMLEHGGKPDLPNKAGETPTELAARVGASAMLEKKH